MNENELEVGMQRRTYDHKETTKEEADREGNLHAHDFTKIELYESSQRRYQSGAKRTHPSALQAVSETHEHTTYDATPWRGYTL